MIRGGAATLSPENRNAFEQEVEELSKRSWSILLQTVSGASRSVCIFSLFLFSTPKAMKANRSPLP